MYKFNDGAIMALMSKVQRHRNEELIDEQEPPREPRDQVTRSEYIADVSFLIDEFMELVEDFNTLAKPRPEWDTAARTNMPLNMNLLAGSEYIQTFEEAVQVAAAASGLTERAHRPTLLNALSLALLSRGLVIRLTPRERTLKLMRGPGAWQNELRKENKLVHRLVQNAWVNYTAQVTLEQLGTDGGDANLIKEIAEQFSQHMKRVEHGNSEEERLEKD